MKKKKKDDEIRSCGKKGLYKNYYIYYLIYHSNNFKDTLDGEDSCKGNIEIPKHAIQSYSNKRKSKCKWELLPLRLGLRGSCNASKIEFRTITPRIKYSKILNYNIFVTDSSKRSKNITYLLWITLMQKARIGFLTESHPPHKPRLLYSMYTRFSRVVSEVPVGKEGN